ncbi:hypothetical protein KXX49_000955, partial [Aspergillus fumigatus]
TQGLLQCIKAFCRCLLLAYSCAIGPTSSLVLLPPALPSALELQDRIDEWTSATLIWMQPVCGAAVSGALWQVSEVLTEATLLAGCRQRQI